MATLDIAMHNLAVLIDGIVGIKEATNRPPEAMVQFPFGVVYPARGEWNLTGGAWSIDFHEVIAEIHLTRGILPNAVGQAMPYYERFRNALANDPTLGGTVATIHGQDRPITYEFGRLVWASNKGKEEVHIGWRWRINLKVHSDLT